jgi:predicted ABC-type ATPase
MTFVAGKSAISDVFVGGKQVVNGGRHIKRASITERYRRVMQRLATL